MLFLILHQPGMNVGTSTTCGYHVHTSYGAEKTWTVVPVIKLAIDFLQKEEAFDRMCGETRLNS